MRADQDGGPAGGEEFLGLLVADGAQRVRLTFSQQLAAGWERYFLWETLIAGGFVALGLIVVYAMLRRHVAWKMVALGVTLACVGNVGGIAATGPKHGASFDCQVDGAQVMFRREVLDIMGDPWLDENPDVSSCRHSDGLFLNRLGEIAGTVPAVGEVLCEHRFTPLSTYTPC